MPSKRKKENRQPKGLKKEFRQNKLSLTADRLDTQERTSNNAKKNSRISIDCMRNNDKTKARAEEREKNIGWITRLFKAWRVSHAERAERRAEREDAGEDDSEEDDTPVVISSSAVTMHPKGNPAPTSSVEVQVFEERVDLRNDMTWRQMIAVGVRRVVLARRGAR